MRNVLVVWDQCVEIEAFKWLEQELDVRVHFAANVDELVEIGAEIHISILLLCFEKEVGLSNFITSCPGASAMLVMACGSEEWALDHLNINIDDEMIFDGGAVSKSILKHKVERLQRQRWNKKAHTIFSGLLTGYPLPFIITRSVAEEPSSLIYCNDQFKRNFDSKQPHTDLSKIDLFDHYSVDIRRDKNNKDLGYFVSTVVGNRGDVDRRHGVHILPISDPKDSETIYHVAFEFEKSKDLDVPSVLGQDMDQLKEQAKAQEKFMANVVHDIRRPLNNIVSLIEILGEQELSEDMQSISTAIWSSGRSLNKLVNDLLSLTKITSGQFEIVNDFFDVKKFVDSIYVMFQKEMAVKGLQFEIQLDADIPGQIAGDENRLTQIIVNFLGNAIKFTHKGSVKLVLKLLRQSENQAVILFSVTDTGIGVRPERQQEIFKSFTQADASIERYYGGTGLGLSICQELTWLMSGRIHMESQLGKGATFSVELPFDIHIPKKNTQEPMDSKSDVHGLSILLVDDNDVITVVLKRLISKWGCSPCTASSFDEAIERFDRGAIDLVITDIQLGATDGVDLAKALKQRASANRKRLPVIGISSHPNPMTKMSRKWLDHFMLKPLNSEELLEKIRLLNTTQSFSVENSQETAMKYEIIDSEKIRSFASGDEKFMKQLIEIFLKRTPEYMEDLNHAVEKQDWTMIKMMAHKVKPTFTYVGMDEFTNKVGSIEDYAIKEDISSIKKIMREVWEDCQRAFKEFEDLSSRLN